jgi:predicted amidohydrolase YtcJ
MLNARSLLLCFLSTTIAPAQTPDTLYLNGKILTLDAEARIVEALSIYQGKVLATGTSADLRPSAGPQTQIIDLAGRCVIPGLIETHCHSLGAAKAELAGPYAEFYSIADVQNWIRERAATLPPGSWIETPRNEITRLKERRFPTPEELDAATTTHPVRFVSVTKTVLNSIGWKTLGITGPDSTVSGGEVVFENGRPVLMRGGQALIASHLPVPQAPSQDAVRAKHEELVSLYNSLGITTLFERATDRAGFDFFQEQAQQNRLNVRVRSTFRFSAQSAADAIAYLDQLGLQPQQGTDMVRASCLKITVDGGIHWGTTWLSEPHGEKRTAFYRNTDPTSTGTQSYSPEQMQAIFAAVNQRGWPMSAHVTGDGGAMAVLRAVETVAQSQPDIRDRRFNLIHCYFPTPEMAQLAKQLNVGVDTQSYLYFRDADFIATIYGPDWAERFIGLAEWVKAGVPVAINSDHMMGFDPNHAMNAFNPFLMLDIAVNRVDDHGNVHGPQQKLSRLDALRALTTWAAWLSFDEATLGSLEPGKLADLVILDRDYLTCPADQIKHIRPHTTLLNGRPVFTAL